jgi:hypothetical protein
MINAVKLAGLWLMFVAFTIALTVTSEACLPGKQLARTVLDIATTTCIIANSDRPDAEVKAICGIIDALDDPMRELLKSSREKTAAARSKGEVVGAASCLSDAGR